MKFPSNLDFDPRHGALAMIALACTTKMLSSTWKAVGQKAMCRKLHIWLATVENVQHSAQMMDIVEIAERVRSARKLRKMTQLQLAEAAHVSLRQVVAFEGGQAPNLGFISIARLLMSTGLQLNIVEAQSARPNYEELLSEWEQRPGV